MNDRLRGRLEDKNIRIMNLEAELEAWKSDRRDELDKMDSIADAALKLNSVFETVQQAADQYLYNIRQRYEEESQRSAGRRS